MTYTPTTEDIREVIKAAARVGALTDPTGLYRTVRVTAAATTDFDRWHAAEIRKAKADAWAEGITASGINLDWQLHLLDHNPYKEEA